MFLELPDLTLEATDLVASNIGTDTAPCNRFPHTIDDLLLRINLDIELLQLLVEGPRLLIHVLHMVGCQTAYLALVSDLQPLQVSDQLIDPNSLLLTQADALLDLVVFSADRFGLASVDIGQLLDINTTLVDLSFIGLCMVVKHDLMLSIKAINLIKVAILHLRDLSSILLMNLWGNLVANILIQVLNLLENSSLELRASACSFSELIITIVLITV